MKKFTDSSGTVWSYDEDHVLGEGGYGTIYRGQDCDGRAAAVKVVASEGKALNSIYDRRELDITNQVVEAGLPTSHLLVPWGGAQDLNYTYLAMPLAETNLKDYLQSTQIELTEIREILQQVASGLVQLAALGILHRDLKPANILRYDGRWCVADFGISRDLKQATSAHTFKGGGTLEYLSPEALDLKPTTSKSDLYALGVIAYELLTGCAPFTGSPDEIARGHRQGAVPPLPSSVPPRLAKFVLRLLDKDPARRPADARAALNALAAMALPLSPAQEEFARSALGVTERDHARNESDRLKAEAEQLVTDARTQAISDLEAMVDLVFDNIEITTPDEPPQILPAEQRGPGGELVYGFQWRSFVLAIEVWRPSSPPPNATADYPLVWGGLYLYDDRALQKSGAPPARNLLYLPTSTTPPWTGKWITSHWRYREAPIKVGVGEQDLLAELGDRFDASFKFTMRMNPPVDEDLDADHLMATFRQFIDEAP